MRVVLDSNILLSALISKAGPPHRIYQGWQQRCFTVITAVIQLDELRRASRYPKFRGVLQPHRVGRMLNNLRGAEVIDPIHIEYEAADPDDAWLLALADTGRADYLVTGDKRAGLLKRGLVAAAGILTAARFCDALDL